jgi:hypothetical protein
MNINLTIINIIVIVVVIIVIIVVIIFTNITIIIIMTIPCVGAYAKVYRVQKKDTGRVFALKVIKKKEVRQRVCLCAHRCV